MVLPIVDSAITQQRNRASFATKKPHKFRHKETRQVSQQRNNKRFATKKQRKFRGKETMQVSRQRNQAGFASQLATNPRTC
jgi:hypothetical protein